MGCNPSLGKAKILRGKKDEAVIIEFKERPTVRRATVHIGMNLNLEEAKDKKNLHKQQTLSSSVYTQSTRMASLVPPNLHRQSMLSPNINKKSKKF